MGDNGCIFLSETDINRYKQIETLLDMYTFGHGGLHRIPTKYNMTPMPMPGRCSGARGA